MSIQTELDTYEQLFNRYTFKNEIHSKRFSQSVIESAYQDSCKELKTLYDEMKSAGVSLGIIHPVQI